MKSLTYLIFLVILGATSCKDSKTNDLYSIKILDKQTDNQEHPGKKLMETNCYVCHGTTASQNDRIGPPMIAIKRIYINNNTTKEAFIASMQAWIKNPNEADAKMKDAVSRFGVMLKMPYPEATIAKIAEYMYDNDIDQPAWFEDHFNQMNPRGNQKGNGKGNGKGQGAGNKNL